MKGHSKLYARCRTFLRCYLGGTALLCASVLWVGCGSAPAPEKTDLAEETPPAEEPPAADNTTTEDADAAARALDEALKNASASRQKAIDAGAEDTTPDELAAADAALELLKARASAGEDVSDELKDLALCYEAMAEYAEALRAKKKIDENGWAAHNQAEYDKGEAAMADVQAMLSSANSAQAAGGEPPSPQSEATAAVAVSALSGKAFYDKAHTANDSYAKVLDGVYREMAQKERTAAFKSKRNADSVYANVSQRARYDTAVESFRNGDRQYTFRHAEEAYNNYAAARGEFDALYTEVSAAMSEADRAIQEAKKKRDESAALARQADKTRPIDENNELLVPPGQTLIEEEAYEDPALSVADVSADMPQDASGNTSGSETVAGDGDSDSGKGGDDA